uniref:Uncharacterized protein MANES_13G078600 n=1 Tax=Rhizophora mucronata TaxID=61149 RepID=A0A2P2MGI2_RHIMU
MGKRIKSRSLDLSILLLPFVTSLFSQFHFVISLRDM